MGCTTRRRARNNDDQGKVRMRTAITIITTGPPTAIASNCSQGGNGEQEGQR